MLFVAFDYSKVDALKKDLMPLVDSYAKLWSTGIPANLAARTVGLGIEDIPGGDTGYLPLSVIPVATSAGKKKKCRFWLATKVTMYISVINNTVAESILHGK